MTPRLSAAAAAARTSVWRTSPCASAHHRARGDNGPVRAEQFDDVGAWVEIDETRTGPGHSPSRCAIDLARVDVSKDDARVRDRHVQRRSRDADERVELAAELHAIAAGVQARRDCRDGLAPSNRRAVSGTTHVETRQRLASRSRSPRDSVPHRAFVPRRTAVGAYRQTIGARTGRNLRPADERHHRQDDGQLDRLSVCVSWISILLSALAVHAQQRVDVTRYDSKSRV